MVKAEGFRHGTIQGMKRRIFLAIDLPADLKQQISEAITQWRWLPIRWLTSENWHITLVPPIYLEDREAERLTAVVSRGRFGKPFLIHFSRMTLAPPGVAARMIWLEGETPPELMQLKKKVGKIIAATEGLPPLKPETRPLHLHATLARFESGELKGLESKTRTLGEVDFRFEASEVVVMESHLKPSGAEYARIATVPLAA